MRPFFLAVVLAFLLVVLASVNQAAAADFAVNTIDDVVDANGCDPVHCSLREAITAANTSPGTDMISFAIPGTGPHTIAPTSALPTITDPVTIDGATQPGYAGTPLIQLDGVNTTSGYGLEISAGNSTVRGLSIVRFGGGGLFLNGGVNNTIQGNYIGLTGTSTAGMGNGSLNITVGSSDSLIGGAAANEGNKVRCPFRSNSGINIVNAAGNVLRGNEVHCGIDVYYGDDTIVGGSGTGEGNQVFSYIWASNSARVTIAGNTLDVSQSGVPADLLDPQMGIALDSSPNSTVGGTAPGAGNVVGGFREGVAIYASPGTVVQGNWIGVDPTGSQRLPNKSAGIAVNSSSVTIGGTAAGTGNVIAYDGYTDGAPGVVVVGASNGSVSILGNRIFANGEAGDVNSHLGIDLSMGGDGVTPNDLGDADTGPNNLQNYPVLSGFWFSGTTSNLSLALNSTPNTLFHIELFANTTCDESGYGEGEQLVASYDLSTDSSGNLTASPAIVGDLRGKYLTATATDPLGNTSEFSACLATVQTFTVTKTADTNDGVCDADCSLREAITAANVTPDMQRIDFNIAGTGPHTITPTSTLPTMTDPVIIDGATQPGYTWATPMLELNGEIAVPPPGGMDSGLSITAGDSTIRGLVINRFTYGIDISNTGGNTIQGNFIGTDVTGQTAVPNDFGILVRDVADGVGNLIGGPGPGMANVISGNGGGIDITYTDFSSENVIEGNIIGLSRDGASVLGGTAQQNFGVIIVDSSDNLIRDNVISGNVAAGIQIDASVDASSAANSNTIQGNNIGTDASGLLARGNRTGIAIAGGDYNQIGGPNPGEGNLISGNTMAGIEITSIACVSGGCTQYPEGNQVQGNFIGTNATGAADLGNQGAGILLNDGSNSVIGGEGANEDNLIAYNSGDGVVITGAASQRNQILPNRIHSNGDLGIDLAADSVTSNDAGDMDTGPNNLQNYPVLSFALTSGTSTDIAGTLNSTANSNFRIEFFANPDCDPSGYGEGEAYVGTTNVTTDGSGNTAFAANLTGVPAGQFITATATDLTGNTSEFSACRLVAAPPTIMAPSNLTAIVISATQVDLTWIDNSSDETEFRVERSADGGATWAQIGTTGANVTSYSDMTVVCGTSYSYRVIAYRSSDGASSMPSNTASATTLACPVNLLVNPSFEALTASRYLPPASPPMVIVQSMQLGVTQEREQIGGLAVPPSTQRGMPYGWSEQNLNPPGTGNGWTCTSVVHDGLCALRIRGNGQLQTVSQTVSAGGRAGDTYTLRFWSRGSALTGVVRARVTVFYPDGTSRTSVRTLPLVSYDWQEQVLRVTPRRPYIRIEVVFEFQGSGTWWLDHTFLGREQR